MSTNMRIIQERLWIARCDAWDRAKALEEQTTLAWQEYEKAKKASEEYYEKASKKTKSRRKAKKASV